MIRKPKDGKHATEKWEAPMMGRANWRVIAAVALSMVVCGL
jgi:hypothetical protein